MTDLQAKLTSSASMSATLRTRTGLALHQILAAGRAAARAIEVERENGGKPLGLFWEEILQNCLAVATLTVSSMECYANELWFEQTIVRPVINDVAAEQLAEIIDMESILKKYSLALALRTGKQLDFGSEPVQSVHNLIRLRNAVVHFQPEWFDAQKKHDRLSKALEGRFAASQFLPNEPIFPRAWATGDFGAWAIRSTVRFLEYFYFESGLECPLTKFKSRLRELSQVAL